MLYWHVHRRRLAALALAGTLTWPLGAAAETARRPSREELEERVRRLERIIEEHGLDRPAPPPAAEAPPVDEAQLDAAIDDRLKQQKVLAGWKDGFFLESPNGDFKLKIRGYVQADARFFPLEQGDTTFDNLYLRRVRPIFEGTVYKYFDYRIMPDFGLGTTTLQDAYLDVKYLPWAKVQAGKYKVALSLERLQSGADLLFVERSLANNLAPNRDIGLTVHGDFVDNAYGYQVGVFDGVFDGGSADTDVTSDKDMAARVFAEPFKPTDIAPLRGLGIGFAATYGSEGRGRGQSLSALNFRTSGRATFFRFDTSSTVSVAAEGDRIRYAPQAYWFWGPAGFMGEYIVSQQDVLRTDSRAGTSVAGSLTNRGWFAQASYVLTGEDASYKTVVPIDDFDPRQGHWGAFEIAARGGKVEIDDDAFRLGFANFGTSTDEASNWGLGVNWYLNRNFKVQADWEHTDFAQDITFGRHPRDHEDVVLTRFQISY